MAEFKEHPVGAPSWIDLQTTDLDKGVEFYTKLFGWKHTSLGEEAGNYGFFLKGDKMVGGIGPKQMEQAPTAWTNFINVTSADEVARKVKDAGGQTWMEPMDVMTAGRMAVFGDTTGGPFGVWEAKDHKGVEIANEPDAWSWSELQTRDVAKAREFYAKVLGWTSEEFAEMGNYVVFKNAGKDIGGCMTMPDMVPKEVGSYWLTYFSVDDADKTAAEIKKLGGTVLVEPQDIPTIGRFAVAMDPQGASFAIIKTEPRAEG